MLQRSKGWKSLAWAAVISVVATSAVIGGTVIEATSAGLSLDTRSGDWRDVGIARFSSNEPSGVFIIIR